MSSLRVDGTPRKPLAGIGAALFLLAFVASEALATIECVSPLISICNIGSVPMAVNKYDSGVRNVRAEPLREFAGERLDATRNAACGIRKRAGILTSTGAQPFTSGQGSGYRQSPSPAVWNCNLHDRFVRRARR